MATITPSDHDDGGIFTPASVEIDDATQSAEFTYEPASEGIKTISMTNDGGFVDPPDVLFEAKPVVLGVPGLRGWWKAETLTTPLNDGDRVSVWFDSSGHGNHATQIGTARPTLKLNAVGTHPSVKFDASLLQFLNLAIPIPVDNWMIFVVMKSTGADMPSIGVAGDGSAGAQDGNFGPAQISSGALYVAQSNWYVNTAAAVDLSAFHVLSGYMPANVFTGLGLYVDGTKPAQSAPSSPTTTATSVLNAIGRRNNIYATGEIAELIVYNQNGTAHAADRPNIEAYLGNKYGIAVAGGTPVDPSVCTAGLLGWWKADSLLTVTDSTPVIAWSDSSGLGNDATQIAPASQPVLKLNAINGLPSVLFNSAWFSIPDIAISGGYTAFAVAISRDYGAQAGGVILGINASLSCSHDWSAGNALYVGDAVVREAFQEHGTGNYRGAWHLYCSIGASSAGVDARLLQDGSPQTVVAGSNQGGFGAAFNLLGKRGDGTLGVQLEIAELIVYSAVTTTIDRQKIEKYLGDKYGFTIAEPPLGIAGLQVWHKADALALADGAAVSAWLDSSGNGWTATPTAATPVPPIFKVVNGKSCVRIIGVNDYLTSGFTLVDWSSPLTAFVVGAINALPADLTHNAAFLAAGFNAEGVTFMARQDTTTNWGTYSYFGGYLSAHEDLVVGEINVFSGHSGGYQSAIGRVFRNGVRKADVSDGTGGYDQLANIYFNYGPQLFIGNTCSCDVYEVLIYNSVLSDADRQAVETYLAKKYGVVSLLRFLAKLLVTFPTQPPPPRKKP